MYHLWYGYDFYGIHRTQVYDVSQTHVLYKYSRYNTSERWGMEIIQYDELH